MNLVLERNELFDETFKPKINDIDRIVAFCQELTSKTGIQCCTFYGAIFECLPQVYESVIKCETNS